MPPKLPIIQDIMMVMVIRKLNVKEIRMRGAIFCQVKINRAWDHSAYSITWGNQKWKGATPAFIVREIVRSNLASGIKFIKAEAWVNRLMKIIIKDAIAWIKKYLMAISMDWDISLLMSKGVKLIKLISSPTHAITQEEEEQARIVPNIRLRIKINW